MSQLSREKAIELLRECDLAAGVSVEDRNSRTFTMTEREVELFANACYALGVADERERNAQFFCPACGKHHDGSVCGFKYTIGVKP